jgi:hypothetical protein
MADFSVTPVAQNIKPPQGMSLGDMVNLARSGQAYQQAQQINPLALQEAQQKVRVGQIGLGVEEQKDLERKNVQTFMANPKNYTNPDGTYNPDAALKGLTAIAPLTGLAHFKDLAGSFGAQETTKKAATETQSAQLDFANKQVLGIASSLTSVINNPLIIVAEQNPESVSPDAIAALLKKYGEERASSLGISKEKADSLIQPYLEQAKNPAGVRQFLKEKLLTTLDQGSRVTAMQPSGVAISTGAGGGVVSTNQFGPYPVGVPIPGTTYEQQIPPTQEVIDQTTGQKRLIGPFSQRTNQPIVTNLGPAQTSLLGAGGTTIGDDWTKTVAEAKEAPQRVAIFQNIKKFAPDSFTGVGGQRKELAAGILNAIGLSAYEAEKVSTEELAKNSALLALAGGNTDAARALAEVATPNKKLNEKAILAIADQMIGIDNMKLARQNFLAPVQNDATKYGQRMLQFNTIADPRLFQEMSRDEVQKLFNSMSPAARAELTNKVRTAKQLGIIK